MSSVVWNNAWESSLREDDAKQAAWLAERQLGIGGSEIGIIMGLSPYKTAFQLWEEKSGKRKAENISGLPHVQRGIKGEIECRQLLHAKYGKLYEPRTWNKGEIFRCTDDGYNSDKNQILEIKCMGKAAHEAASSGEIPETYRLQCQWNLMVSGCETCLFISYRPEDQSMHEVVIAPDHEEHKKLTSFAADWWQKYMVDGLEHPRSASDYKTIKGSGNSTFEKAAFAYIKLKDRHDQDAKDLARLKEIMAKELSDDCPAVRGAGVRLARTTRKGNIEYGKIEALKHINLEDYRKPAISLVSIYIDPPAEESADDSREVAQASLPA